MNGRWGPEWTADGAGQAGLPSRPDDQGAGGVLTMAVVLSVTWPEDDDRSVAGQSQRAILLDLRTVGPRPVYLPRVPLLGWQQWTDEDVIVPRATTQDLDGGQLVTDTTSGTTKPTTADKLDGDWVLVGFLDNSLTKPVAIPLALPRQGLSRRLSKADGRLKRLQYNGTAISWDQDGNLLLDATAATRDALGAKGATTSAAGTGGTITLQTKDAGGATSSVTLDATGGVAIEDADSCSLTFTKASKIAKMTAGAKAQVAAPLVELATAPMEPVAKATSLDAAVIAALTTIQAYLVLAAAAFDELKTLPPTATGKGLVLAASKSSPAYATTVPLITATWTAAKPGWTSAKVTTG